MPLPYVFANVTELDTPQLDADFNAVAALGVIPCTASGTNTIVLTPGANTPTISAYTSNAPEFSFEAANTSTGAMTISILGVGGKNVYKNNGATAAGANDFIQGSLYKVSYNAALNSAAGGWVILNQGATASAAGAVQGTPNRLKIQSTSDTAITVTATQLAVSDGSLSFITLFNVNVSIATGTSGANGLDTGAIAASTWYYVYVIYNVNTSTAAGLISLSATAPTLPSGYTLYAAKGEVITDGSAHLLRTIQYGQDVQYTVGTNPTVMPLIASSTGGAVGTYSTTSPTLATASVAGVVPPTAAEINISVNNNYKAAGNNGILVAPNTSYGGVNNGPVGSNGQSYASWIAAGTGFACSFWMLLEATTIAWATSGTSGSAACLGWRTRL